MAARDALPVPDDSDLPHADDEAEKPGPETGADTLPDGGEEETAEDAAVEEDWDW